MNVGDIVRRLDNANLCSGTSQYGAAVVVQVDPLVLVSEHADMRWESTIQDVDFGVVSEVTKEHLNKCLKRL
tara:strand:- start:901 stop:1116 length:216 start_codon:yes stop_codon:yes gene_type:complete